MNNNNHGNKTQSLSSSPNTFPPPSILHRKICESFTFLKSYFSFENTPLIAALCLAKFAQGKTLSLHQQPKECRYPRYNYVKDRKNDAIKNQAVSDEQMNDVKTAGTGLI